MEQSRKRLRFDTGENGANAEDQINSPGLPTMPTDAPTDYRKWDAQEVSSFLREKGVQEEHVNFIRGQNITGKVLPDLNEKHLETAGVKSIGDQLEILQIIKSLLNGPVCDVSRHTRVFNDPIHGHIELHPLLVKVLDTPQFQRLRFLRQLGGCYFVYPGASNNRFEHSIGVGHLAGELVRLLQKKQPELNIDERDVLCVQMAGLCHDLGHGPFSHMYDGKFMEVARPGYKWKHEDGSVAMFQHLIEVNELRPVFKKYGLSEQDITFVIEMISGPKRRRRNQEWPYTGRDKSKGFLYEIVANKRNGIDVDKWDYFARDCHHLGIQNSFDHVRYMKFTRVLKVDQDYQICARDKEVGNLYDMFQTRHVLHRRAYQHKTVQIVEIMITEALLKADDHLLFPGKNGKMYRMSEAMDDMVAFTQLTDHVFETILYSTKPELAESKQILTNILSRKLYKCIGQTSPGASRIQIDEETSIKYRQEIIAALPEKELGEKLKTENLIVQVASFDYGMKEKNPVDNVRFYRKEVPDVAFQLRKDQVSQMLPHTFAEQTIRVYCKLLDEESIEKAKRCFQSWCIQHAMSSSNAGIAEFTPIKAGSSDVNLPPTPKTPKQSRQSLALD